MNHENINRLINKNIIKIYNKKTLQNIIIDDIKCELIKTKDSSSKNPIYKIILNGNIINRNNKYNVIYKCLSCDSTNNVNLNNLTRKINKNIICCKCCGHKLNPSNEKNVYYKGLYKNNIKYMSNKELIEISEKEFNNIDDDFKELYNNRHITLTEYEILQNKILSIQNDKIKNIINYKYCPYIKCFNQHIFTPKLYDQTEDKFIDIKYIKYKCENCNNDFINRDLYIQKNKIKLLCQSCNLCNNVFKIRHKKNIHNENVCYQSKIELDLINNCNLHNIYITNGPKINYFFNDKQHLYYIDYIIPTKKLLIELKDNHIWHKNQVLSGKWQEKEKSAIKYAQKIGYKFLLIFQKDKVKYWDYIFNKI